MKRMHYFWHIWICIPRFYLQLLRPSSELTSVASLGVGVKVMGQVGHCCSDLVRDEA